MSDPRGARPHLSMFEVWEVAFRAACENSSTQSSRNLYLPPPPPGQFPLVLRSDGYDQQDASLASVVWSGVPQNTTAAVNPISTRVRQTPSARSAYSHLSQPCGESQCC